MLKHLLAPSLLLAGTAILSFALTGLAILVARRLRLFAHPVERSSHTIPTPQVGGVGICLTLLIFLVFAGNHVWYDWSRAWPEISTADRHLDTLRWTLATMIAFGLALGLLDDVRHLSPLKKLAGLIVLTAIPLSCGLFTVTLHSLLTLEAVLAFAWILFFINAFNFMDGVNGQAGVFTINALFWWGLFPHFREFAEVGGQWPPLYLPFIPFNIAMAGAVLGFFFWNFPRARTFMGDSGSLTLGALLALRALGEGRSGFCLWIGYLLPLSFFIYDVIYTLIRRVIRRENLLEAHRSHLYQRLLIATGWSHARLLAFHLPFYLLAGLAGLLYHYNYWKEPPAVLWSLPRGPAQIACLAGTAALLVTYTLLVLRFEKRKAKETAP